MEYGSEENAGHVQYNNYIECTPEPASTSGQNESTSVEVHQVETDMLGTMDEEITANNFSAHCELHPNDFDMFDEIDD